MESKNLFTLRYRMGTTGAITAYLTASTLAKAEEVGRWWCNQQLNRRYITVIPAVVADESDLQYVSVEERDAKLAEANAPKAPEKELAGVGAGVTDSSRNRK